MFDIRVICNPADAPRVTEALNALFLLSDLDKAPTRDGERLRLYATAAHAPWLDTTVVGCGDTVTVTLEDCEHDNRVGHEWTVLREHASHLVPQLLAMSDAAHGQGSVAASAPPDFPAPEVAYAEAPSIVREIGYVADQAANRALGQPMGREFWLRKAAVLDRIALADEAEGTHEDASDVAAQAGLKFVQFDGDGIGDYYGVPFWAEHPEAHARPRGYVRQEYAHWASTQ